MTNNSNEVLLVDEDMQDKSIIENTLSHFDYRSVHALEDLLALDQEARSLTEQAISQVA